ncbi:ABC-F family ATP-binding cassette domain-containing protein [Rosenbergiella nectarea]|uniref:ABC-F family ATP-binding cassette domain-containing protein n=1 Tax=Rosenbergiella nectarea TaxID=988801 RepID=UPI001F4E040A|nr:ABC-F family ATP-binding cassette domain-containing protein [Rosenbergiella nectarea]
MSTFISVKNLSIQTPEGVLFENISFTISRGDRIGLVGRNGVGKSTLLKTLNGDLIPSTGNISKSGNCILAIVEQHLPDSIRNLTSIDAVLRNIPSDKTDDDYWKADSLLDSIGFSMVEKNQPCMHLSGGQQSRVLLARAIINSPDLLIMDEPSNHLDMSSIIWLESFLQNWQGGYIISSHDSKLLDRITNKTLFLRDKKIHYFSKSYSDSKLELLKCDESDRLRHQAEQKEINRISSSAQRLAIWGKNYDSKSLSRKAKSMEKHLDILVENKTELTEGNYWNLNLNGESLVADKVIDFINFPINPSKTKEILKLSDLRLKPNEHVAVIGKNGAGKSSLLASIWQALNTNIKEQDNIKFNPRIKMGYYDQNLEQLNDNDTIFDSLESFQPDPKIRKQSLIKAGYRWERHDQIVSTLSGGERSRLLFLGLSLASYNILMLDEPTNHLDIDGKEDLALNLASFPGAFLVVSHDRDFIESCCNSIWLIDNGVIEVIDSLQYVENLYDEENYNNIGTEISVKKKIKSNLTSEDDFIDRIMLLQKKIEDDECRKVKHQKPELRKEWQEELNKLYSKLSQL